MTAHRYRVYDHRIRQALDVKTLVLNELGEVTGAVDREDVTYAIGGAVTLDPYVSLHDHTSGEPLFVNDRIKANLTSSFRDQPVEGVIVQETHRVVLDVGGMRYPLYYINDTTITKLRTVQPV